jgi:hypothetical protein
MLAPCCGPPTPLNLTTCGVEVRSPSCSQALKSTRRARTSMRSSNHTGVGRTHPRCPGVRSRDGRLQAIVSLTLLCSMKSTARVPASYSIKMRGVYRTRDCSEISHLRMSLSYRDSNLRQNALLGAKYVIALWTFLFGLLLAELCMFYWNAAGLVLYLPFFLLS